MADLRELTVAKYLHPEYLEDGTYLRVDHPGLNALVEYDPRCVIYLHLRAQRFYLFRLEHDDVYRPTAMLPPGRSLNEATVNRLIQQLDEHDTRKGFDPYFDVVNAQKKWAEDRRKETRAWIEDVGDKLHWGLSRSYLPGIDISRPRLVPKRV